MCSTPLDTTEHQFMRAVVRHQAIMRHGIGKFLFFFSYLEICVIFKSILFAFCEHVRSHTRHVWLSWPDGTPVRHKIHFNVCWGECLNTNLWLFDCALPCQMPFSATHSQQQSTVTPNTFLLLHSRTHKFQCKHFTSSCLCPNECTLSSDRCKIVGMPESINALELLVRRSSSWCSMLHIQIHLNASSRYFYLESLPLATQPVKVSCVVSSNKYARHCTEPRSMNNLQQIANRKV